MFIPMMQEQLLKQCVKSSVNLDSQRISSDQGRNFLSNQFMQFLNGLGIDLTFCSVYHHSSNPAEHAIRNVKNLMKHCGSANKHGTFHYLNIQLLHLVQDYPH